MSFKDTQEGQTHSYGDGCGEPAHNKSTLSHTIEEIEKALLEKCADIEHERWSKWHRHMRDKWTPENIARWDKQAATPYAKLSEIEKESDRREVRSYLPLLKAALERVARETAAAGRITGETFFPDLESDDFDAGYALAIAQQRQQLQKWMGEAPN